jgi:Ras-related protein Rab-24
MTHHVDFKVVLLGKEYCGKTSLVERYLNDRFVGENRYQNTIGAAYGSKKVTVEGRSLVVGIWDTAGSERYEAMSKIYYRNARAAILCYDVSDPDSFHRLRYWIKELQKNQNDTKMYLCANKVDLIHNGRLQKRLVDYHETTDLADEMGAKLYETSAKSGENVKELFNDIVSEYVRDPKTSLTLFERHERHISLSSLAETTSSKCCSR